MPLLEPPGIPWAELDTSQSDRFVANSNSALRHKILDIAAAQTEAVIEPDRVLNDRRREAVTFVRSMNAYSSRVVTQRLLICQYPMR